MLLTRMEFPTLLEILKGIQEEEKIYQLSVHVNENHEYLNKMILNIQYIWQRIFLSVIKRDFKKRLTFEELTDPSKKIVSSLIYIYSMETPLVYILNTACRE